MGYLPGSSSCRFIFMARRVSAPAHRCASGAAIRRARPIRRRPRRRRSRRRKSSRNLFFRESPRGFRVAQVCFSRSRRRRFELCHCDVRSRVGMPPLVDRRHHHAAERGRAPADVREFLVRSRRNQIARRHRRRQHHVGVGFPARGFVLPALMATRWNACFRACRRRTGARCNTKTPCGSTRSTRLCRQKAGREEWVP